MATPDRDQILAILANRIASQDRLRRALLASILLALGAGLLVILLPAALKILEFDVPPSSLYAWTTPAGMITSALTLFPFREFGTMRMRREALVDLYNLLKTRDDERLREEVWIATTKVALGAS